MKGIVDFTETQWDAMYLVYQVYRENWISEIIRDTSINSDVEGGEPEVRIAKGTLNVLRRKFNRPLGVYSDWTDKQLKCRTRAFSDTVGESTVTQIIDTLEEGKKVVIDTSMLEDQRASDRKRYSTRNSGSPQERKRRGHFGNETCNFDCNRRSSEGFG